MAGFATNTVRGVERPGPLRLGHAQRVAPETFRRGICPVDTQDLGHARGHGIGEHRERVRMLILDHPSAVLVLLHRGVGANLHAAVAAGRSARTGPGILGRLRCLTQQYSKREHQRNT